MLRPRHQRRQNHTDNGQDDNIIDGNTNVFRVIQSFDFDVSCFPREENPEHQ